MNDLKSFINQLRRDFASHSLDEKNISRDPLSLFETWMSEAVRSEVPEPNAMVVSTVSDTGIPSSRIVLLRDYSADGFVFFTNYNSRKGKDINSNDHACLLFFWPELERQIRITGRIKKTDTTVSDEYFASRPRESQIGAWASHQSERISSRTVLEEKVKELEKDFDGKVITRPPHWGGYIINADEFEFWQGRPSRLHDRIRYERKGNDWQLSRVSP